MSSEITVHTSQVLREGNRPVAIRRRRLQIAIRNGASKGKTTDHLEERIVLQLRRHRDDIATTSRRHRDDIATTKTALASLRTSGINLRGAFVWNVQSDADAGYLWQATNGLGGTILSHP